MAEPVSTFLAIATVTCQAILTLHELVKSFNSHNDRVNDLQGELSGLLEVLHRLMETVNTNTKIDLSSLELPIKRCETACTSFADILLKCSSHSKGMNTSFRDWMKLKYMGEDIDGVRRLLSSYKQTISVAMLDANM